MANNKPLSLPTSRKQTNNRWFACTLSQVQPVFVPSSLPVSKKVPNACWFFSENFCWHRSYILELSQTTCAKHLQFGSNPLDSLVAGIVHDLLLEINHWFAGRQVILVGKSQRLRQTFVYVSKYPIIIGFTIEDDQISWVPHARDSSVWYG